MIKIKYAGITVALFLFTGAALSQVAIDFRADCTRLLHEISPLIYGTNQVLTGEENWTLFRLGGNRMTGYNWENNASNAGLDWYHQSDNYLTWISGITDENEPGIVLKTFHERSMDFDARSIMVIQMAGYVAADKNGPVSEAETAPSDRWIPVFPRKGSVFENPPDPDDDAVYMDELVNFMIEEYGDASGDGVMGFCLDNEPALWSHTHPRIHPQQATCIEVVTKNLAYASAVKNVDPHAVIMGPCLYGFAAYNDFQAAPDWNTVRKGKGYGWFIDYYLDEMKKAEADSGRRLLDVLTVHWYPEAQGDYRITEADALTQADHEARVQAPRTLWDPAYVEDSWIGQWGKHHLPLIPKLQASIDRYYPGTRLAFNEFCYGAPEHISGTIALADVLGIFMKTNVYAACLWPLSEDCPSYTAAYQIYRNVDGLKPVFGNRVLESAASDPVISSIYGSVTENSGQVHLIVINKSFTEGIHGRFTIVYNGKLTGGEVWGVSGVSLDIRSMQSVGKIENNTFTYTLPSASVCHFILETSPGTKVESPGSDTGLLRLDVSPNPFNSSCRIKATGSGAEEMNLSIASMTGRIVKIFSSPPSEGFRIWDGLDDQGRKMASGLYFVLANISDRTRIVKKVMLLQ